MVNNELYHYGIKGQKWGERNYQYEDGTYTPEGRRRYGFGDARAKYKAAKANYRLAKREYSKSFNKAYNKSIAAYSPFKKHRDANDKRWKDVHDKIQNVESAKKNYKSAKKEYKNSDEYKARRKKALKIGAAVAGTALVAYGGYKLYKRSKDTKEMASINNKIRDGMKQVERLRKSNLLSDGALSSRSQVRYLGNDLKYHTADKYMDLQGRVSDFSNYAANTQREFRNLKEYRRARKTRR